MKNKYLKFLFPIALILALTVSMIGTRSVLADDAPPTPTDEIPTETPPVEEPSETQETLEQTVPEILEQLPAETEIVVLDENSEPLPLVSNEAANVLVTGDPQWCVAGHTPADDPFGGTFCTAKFTKFNGSGGLIEELINGSGIDTGAGTIFIAYDYDAATAGDAGTDVIFDYGALDLTDLVVQGGWDFTQDKVVGTSTIDLAGSSLEFWDWGGYGAPANLTLKDLVVKNSNSLFIGDNSDTTTADVVLDNVIANNVRFGTYIGTDGKVDISNSKFNNSSLASGLMVESLGDITLMNVYADGNAESGAELYNDCGCNLGNIFVSSSEFNVNGTSSNGRGLIAHSLGDITLTDVAVLDNGGGGAELINCFFLFGGGGSCVDPNPGKITVKGTSIFKNNGYNPPQLLGTGPYASVGLWIGSNSDVLVDGATVEGNGAGNIAGGALVFTYGGTMTLTNTSFSNNCTTYNCDSAFGLIALNLGGSSTTLNGVSANGNGNGDGGVTFNSDGGVGALIFNGNGNIFVQNSAFNNNCNVGTCSGGGGVFAQTSANVTFNQVTASNNGLGSGSSSGTSIIADGNVDIYCSTFNNNDGVGLLVDVPSGSVLTMKGVSYSGNLTDFVPPSGGGIWTSDPNCPVSVFSGASKGSTDLPLRVVNVGSGNGTDLDCENYSGTKLMLENGDNLVVPCPLGGSASLTKQDANGLPSSLPSGSTFRSGIVSVVTESGSVDGKLSQPVLVSFIMPEGVDASALAILYWDGSQWTEVNGTFVLTENGKTYFAAFVNYTGTFVLVQR